MEKGDQVKEGQVLVRLEDQEFRAQYEQAAGAAESARAQLLQLQNGSRPQEVEQTEHNLSEAKATAANDKISLDRIKKLETRVAALEESNWALREALAKTSLTGWLYEKLRPKISRLQHYRPRPLDVPHFAVATIVPVHAENGMSAQRFKRKRRHKRRCRMGHRHAHLRSGLVQSADQVRRLVRRNAAGNEHHDPAFGKTEIGTHAKLSFRPASFGWSITYKATNIVKNCPAYPFRDPHEITP